MNCYNGLIIGAATFLIIGLFHPIVIKAEYHFGVRCWWIFLITGLASIVASVLIPHPVISALCAVLGFTLLWSIKELFEQKKRVEKRWFPKKPE